MNLSKAEFKGIQSRAVALFGEYSEATAEDWDRFVAEAAAEFGARKAFDAIELLAFPPVGMKIVCIGGIEMGGVIRSEFEELKKRLLSSSRISSSPSVEPSAAQGEKP